jgi:hypothetical protein
MTVVVVSNVVKAAPRMVDDVGACVALVIAIIPGCFLELLLLCLVDKSSASKSPI